MKKAIQEKEKKMTKTTQILFQMHSSPRDLIFYTDGSPDDFTSMLLQSVHTCLTTNQSLGAFSKSQHCFVRDSDTKMPKPDI